MLQDHGRPCGSNGISLCRGIAHDTNFKLKVINMKKKLANVWQSGYSVFLAIVQLTVFMVMTESSLKFSFWENKSLSSLHLSSLQDK
jgi:hypothetical protein